MNRILNIMLLMVFLAAAFQQGVAQQTNHLPQLNVIEHAIESAQIHKDPAGKLYYVIDPDMENVRLPIPPNTMIIVQTNRDITTKRLSGNDVQTLTLPALDEITGKYARYVDPGNPIAVEVRGKSSGVVKQAYIEVEIKSVVVNFPQYIKIGERDGRDILLSPGTYRLTLSGALRNFQFAGLFNRNVGSEESQRIRRGFFGNGSNSTACDDKLTPLSPFNLTPLPFFAVCGVAKLIRIGIRRPNWYLPAQTSFTFDIDKISATRMQGIPPEVGSLTRVNAL